VDFQSVKLSPVFLAYSETGSIMHTNIYTC
jgi:hypothetical protein